MYPLFACSSTLFSQLTGTAIIGLLPLVVLILFEAKLINAPREDKPFESLKYITVINLIAAISAISIIFIIDHEIKHTENGNGIIILFFWLALPLLLIGIEYITYQGECKNISKRKLLTSLIIINIISYITFSALTIFICSVSSRGYPKSRRISCTSNLKQIGLSLKQYAMDYDNYFPDKGLEQIRSNDYLTDVTPYNCPSTKTQKLGSNQPLTNKNIDYIYRAGLHDPPVDGKDSSKIPVLWDKPTNHKDYGNVLFLDGHVKGFKGKNWMEQAGIKKKNIVKIMSFKKQIRKSLKKLLMRTNSDNFVIFSEPKTGKYCQLASDENGLFFDLPFLTLSKAEIKRAELVLAKHGIPKPVYCRMYDSSGKNKKEVEGWKAFQKKIGSNVDAATEIVIAVFTEVYQFDQNTKFKIEEN